MTRASPNEHIVSAPTALVPRGNVNSPGGVLNQSSAAPKASQSEQGTAFVGIEKSCASPVRVWARTNPAS